MGVHPKYQVGDVVAWDYRGYERWGVIVRRYGNYRINYVCILTDPYGRWEGSEKPYIKQAHQLRPLTGREGKARRNMKTVHDWRAW